MSVASLRLLTVVLLICHGHLACLYLLRSGFAQDGQHTVKGAACLQGLQSIWTNSMVHISACCLVSVFRAHASICIASSSCF